MILHWIWRGELVFSSLEMKDCKNKAHRAKYMDGPAMLSNHNLWEVTAHWVFFHESLTKSYHHKITTYRNEKNHRSVILAASVIWRALIGQRLHGHSSCSSFTVRSYETMAMKDIVHPIVRNNHTLRACVTSWMSVRFWTFTYLSLSTSYSKNNSFLSLPVKDSIVVRKFDAES